MRGLAQSRRTTLHRERPGRLPVTSITGDVSVEADLKSASAASSHT